MDGWRFIGRGLLPIRGRAMYERLSCALDVDFAANPELILTPEHALPAACGNDFADRNDMLGLTRAIHGCTAGLASRSTWLTKTRELWPQAH
jgi:putative chitinase